MKYLRASFLAVNILFCGVKADVFVEFAQSLNKVVLLSNAKVTITSQLKSGVDGIEFLNGTRYEIECQGNKAYFYVKNGSDFDPEGNLLTQGTQAVVDAANSNINPGATVSAALFNAFKRHKKDGMVNDWQKFLNGAQIPVGTARLNTNPDVRVKGSCAACLPMQVIHAVGPGAYDGSEKKNKQLASAYISALQEAEKASITSLSFPLISMGVFLKAGTDYTIGLGVAVDAILSYMCETLKKNKKIDVHLLTYNNTTWFGDLNKKTQEWFAKHSFDIFKT